MKPMEEIVGTTINSTATNSGSNSSSSKPSSTSVERKVRPQKDQALNCPRCNSTNTKFCYYNNYSLSQPRYFCKTCRRYWTEGGSLRNIPVGGGSRKNKRSSSSSSAAAAAAAAAAAHNNDGLAVKKMPDLVPPVPIPHHHHHQHQHQNPSKIHDHQGGSSQQDLNLGFSHHHHQDFKTITELIQVPNYESNNKDGGNPHHPSSSSSSSASQLSALELLTGMTSSRGLMSSFIPMPIPDPNSNSVYSSFPLPEFKPSLNFSLDGIGNGGGGYGNHHHHLQGMQETTTSGGGGGGGGGGRLFFPFEDLKSTTAPDGGEQDRDNNPAGESTGHGYWNGVLGAGGGSW